MYISEDTLKRLDYFKVLEKIAREASFDSSRTLILSMRPERIDRSLWESVEEFRSLIKFGLDRKISSAPDPGPFLKKVSQGVMPREREFYEFALFLSHLEEISSLVKNTLFLRKHFVFKTFSELREKIFSVVEENGIKKDASPLLKKLFPELESLSRKARELCYKELDSRRNIFRGRFYKVISGRYVLPLISGILGSQSHASYLSRGRISGHSEGGATVYFEPPSVMALNDEIEKLQSKISAEITRLLGELSMEISQNQAQHERNLSNFYRLDMIKAIAIWAARSRASYPSVVKEPVLKLVDARNPLLKDPVPISLAITEDKPVMLITGPNTGGKTVTLKTVGLFVAFLYAGIPFPSSPESVLGGFEKVFADIGDEQSVEQSLSTFASHLKVLVELYNSSPDSRTLFLWDEIGAGTDPHEGASLGVAVLRDLLRKNVRVVATTHHEYVKNFALSEERVETASMEFDLETLSPTYHLVVGVPGSSYALEIAERMGLPPGIVEEARFLLGEERKIVERTTRKIAEELRKQERISYEMEREKLYLKEKIEALFAQAAGELRRVIQSLEKGHIGKKKAREELFRIKKEVEEEMEKIAPTYRHLNPEEIRESMEVLVIPFGRKGKVVSVEGEKVEVLIGTMRVLCSLKELAKV